MTKLSARFANKEELPDGSKDCDWLKDGTLTESFHHRQYQPEEIPKHVDVPIYLNYKLSGEYDAGKLLVHTDSYYLNSEDADRVELNLARIVLSVPLPPVNLVACTKTMLESLEREKQKIMAESQKQLNDVEEKRQKLLAITHQEG